MKNKHIALVKKYLADPKSVTQAELKANRNAADDALCAAPFNAYATAYAVAYAAANAAYYATYFATDEYAIGAVYWVKRYGELSK